MSCLPYVTVQHDYAQVFDEIARGEVAAERVWTSIYALNAPTASIHARILLVSDEPERDQPAAAQDGGGGVYIAEVKPADQVKVERVEDAPKDLVISSVYRPAEDSEAPPSTSARHPQQRLYLPPVRCVAPRSQLPFPSSNSLLRLRKGVSPLVTVFDVSPKGDGLYLAGGPDGKCWVGRLPPASTTSRDTAALEPIIILDGHVGDLTSARFFPSGEVILTAGSDFRVCIFSALSADAAGKKSGSAAVNEPVRTLVAHTRAPTSTVILGKGRIVMSGGKDGIVRCWNVADAKEVGNLPACEAVTTSLFGPSIECMVLGREAQSDQEMSNEELVFPGALPLLAVGLSTGEVVVHDLRRCALAGESSDASDTTRSQPIRVQPSETTRATIAAPTFPPGPPLDASDAAQAWISKRSTCSVTSIAWTSTYETLLVGYSNGLVAAHKAAALLDGGQDSTGSLLALWKRNDASVTHIEVVPSNPASKPLQLIVTTSDGLACRLLLDLAARTELGLVVPSLKEEFIGWECGDNISVARVVSAGPGATAHQSQRLALAGAGGSIRLYPLRDIDE